MYKGAIEMYKDLNTGEYYSFEEIKEVYEDFKNEMPYKNFEEYFECQIRLGSQRVGGFVKIDNKRKESEDDEF